MARKQDETVREYLARMMAHSDYEKEAIFDDFPTAETLLDYWAMLDEYDVDFLADVMECIMEDDRLDGEICFAYNKFVLKHKLNELKDSEITWRTCDAMNPAGRVLDARYMYCQVQV